MQGFSVSALGIDDARQVVKSPTGFDGAVPVMLWLSWAHPVVLLVVLTAVVVVSIVVVWVLWRFIARLMRRMRGGYAAALE